MYANGYPSSAFYFSNRGPKKLLSRVEDEAEKEPIWKRFRHHSSPQGVQLPAGTVLPRFTCHSDM